MCFFCLLSIVLATAIYISKFIQYIFLDYYIYMWSVRLVSRYLLTSSFHFSAKHILRRSWHPGSPETKSSKMDDIICTWEKGQTDAPELWFWWETRTFFFLISKIPAISRGIKQPKKVRDRKKHDGFKNKIKKTQQTPRKNKQEGFEIIYFKKKNLNYWCKKLSMLIATAVKWNLLHQMVLITLRIMINISHCYAAELILCISTTSEMFSFDVFEKSDPARIWAFFKTLWMSPASGEPSTCTPSL